MHAVIRILALAVCVGAAGAQAAEPGSVDLMLPCRGSQTIATLCRADAPPQTADLVITAASICRLTDTKVQVFACVMSDTVSLPAGSRLAVSSAFGVLRPPSAGRHLWAMGGQTDVLETATLPGPGGRPRLAAVTGTEIELPGPVVSNPINVADRLLVQVTWWLCGPGRAACNPPSMSPTISRMVAPVVAGSGR